MKAALKFRADLGRDLVTPQGGIMDIKLHHIIEFVLFDTLTPAACIAVKGRKGLREVISRRKDEKERRQKEAASENKDDEKK